MALNIRLYYEKTGRAGYLSHLDLMRAFRRAFCKTALPLRYSEGFNPHIYLSVALPMPVGMESFCERLDFGVNETVSCGSLPGLLNDALPDGLRVTRAHLGGRPFPQIAWTVYRLTLDTKVSPQEVQELFTSSAVVEKRSKKKGIVSTDIVPMIRHFRCMPSESGLLAEMAILAQNPGLNPSYIAEAFRLYLDAEVSCSFQRITLLDAEGNPFDPYCELFAL